jgi:hypothetical protein
MRPVAAGLGILLLLLSTMLVAQGGAIADWLTPSGERQVVAEGVVMSPPTRKGPLGERWVAARVVTVELSNGVERVVSDVVEGPASISLEGDDGVKRIRLPQRRQDWLNLPIHTGTVGETRVYVHSVDQGNRVWVDVNGRIRGGPVGVDAPMVEPDRWVDGASLLTAAAACGGVGLLLLMSGLGRRRDVG